MTIQRKTFFLYTYLSYRVYKRIIELLTHFLLRNLYDAMMDFLIRPTLELYCFLYCDSIEVNISGVVTDVTARRS